MNLVMLIGFQFLIGNLITDVGDVVIDPVAGFQFLIGNLITYSFPYLCLTLYFVSIPYR